MKQLLSKNRAMATLATNLLVLMIAIVLTMISPLVTQITKEYSLDKIQTGFIFTSNFIGFTIFILFGGLVADRFGKKKVLSVTSSLLVLFLLLFSIVPSYLTACLVVVLIGGACGIIESIASAWLAELNSKKASMHINISQIYFGIGALAGPYVSGLLIEGGWTWRQVYQLTSVLALIVSIYFIVVKVNILPVNESESVAVPGLKKLAGNRLLLLLCLCMFLYAGSEIGAWGWMATYMMEKLNFTIVESSLSVGVFWMAMIVGRMVCTSILNRFQSRYIIIFLAFASAIATVASGFAATKTQAWIATILIGLFYSSLWPLIVAYGSEKLQSSSSTIFSLLVGSGGIGSSVIPIFMGFLGQKFSIKISMVSPAVFLALVAVIFIFIPKMEKSEQKGGLT